jgi:hypothetical protein
MYCAGTLTVFMIKLFDATEAGEETCFPLTPTTQQGVSMAFCNHTSVEVVSCQQPIQTTQTPRRQTFLLILYRAWRANMQSVYGFHAQGAKFQLSKGKHAEVSCTIGVIYIDLIYVGLPYAPVILIKPLLPFLSNLHSNVSETSLRQVIQTQSLCR